MNPCLQRVPRFPSRFLDYGIVDIDLLFVIDDSPGMAEEQATLAEAIPRLLNALITGQPSESDPLWRANFPVNSLRVGVISTDMGVGGNAVPSCGEASFGKDGRLIERGASDPACEASYPAFLEFARVSREDDDSRDARIAQLARDVSCVAPLGTEGCTYGQPLEAVLKALTPASSELRFQGGTRGNGDRNRIEGAGFFGPDDDAFLRPNSNLVIVLLTNDDDASVSEPDLYNADSTRFRGSLGLRSFNHPEAIYPVSRYVEGLIALRPASPSSVTFAAITGVPDRLIGERPDFVDYDRILDDPAMQERIDPEDRSRLRASCEAPGGGRALPPRRLVTLARELEARGARTVVASICGDDYGPALDAIVRHVAVPVGRVSCLSRPRARSVLGLVPCEVTELLPAAGPETRCDIARGRELIEVVEWYGSDGVQLRERCRVRQLTRREYEAGELGWVYDDFDAEALRACSDSRPYRVSFARSAEPARGASIAISCGQRYVPAGASLSIQAPCEGATHSERDAFCREATRPASPLYNARLADQLPEGSELFCEPVSLTCQLGCVADDDCLPGEVCVDVDVPAHAERPAWQGVCVDPTCVYGGSS
ncbi:MAG: hypothetical protein AAGH15_09345 [Myxococcota bacterium]